MLIGIFYSQIVESSSLFSVLFREVISHPYISFFHLLVNGFSVTSFHTFSKTLYLYYTGVLIGIFYSQIVESSSLVSVLFREVFSHPYISFFHLLVNGFSVIIIIIIIIRFFRRVFSECTEAVATSLYH